MNAQDRKTLSRVQADIAKVREAMLNEETPLTAALLKEWAGAVDDARSQVEEAKDTEQEKFDNMPESFQNGEKGERSQAAIDALEEAQSALEGVNSDLETTSFDEDNVRDTLATISEGLENAEQQIDEATSA